MKAADIMTSNVLTIRGSATVAAAVKMMRDKKLRSLIVDRRHDQDAYGIITETDVVYKVTAYGLDPKKVRVHEVMTKPCVVVSPDLEVEYVARLFANTRIRRAPVVEGKLLGIISTSDILSKATFVEEPKEIRLKEKIREAVALARTTCAASGANSKECATAWDEVEELQAELAHQQARAIPQTAFDEYCAENPEALEARQTREYDV